MYIILCPLKHILYSGHLHKRSPTSICLLRGRGLGVILIVFRYFCGLISIQNIVGGFISINVYSEYSQYIQILLWVYMNTKIVGGFISINVYNETSRNRPTLGPNLNGPFMEVVGSGSQNIIIMTAWDPNKLMDIGEWSICGGVCQRGDYIYIYIYIHTVKAF